MEEKFFLRARILQETAEIYEDCGMESEKIEQLTAGDIVYLGKTINKDWKKWVMAKHEDKVGYIEGDVKIFPIQKVKLLQKDVNVYEKPNKNSNTVIKLNKNDIFYLTDLIKADKKDWVRIHDLSSNAGFIDGGTRIEYVKLPDLASDLKGWGIGLIIIGVLSVLLSGFLNAGWGVFLILFGIAALFIKNKGMYIAIGLCLMLAGASNIFLTGSDGWMFFGVLQLYWGFQELTKFWKYKNFENEPEDQDEEILKRIEQESIGTGQEI